MREGAARRFRIDPNVRLGDLLILGTLAFAGISAWFSVKEMSERNTRDLAAFVVTQDRRDQMQDQVVVRIEGNLREGIQQIRQDQTEMRRDVGEIGRFVRGRGM